MLSGLFGQKRGQERTARAIYGAIVSQARSPALYRDLAVPDTVSGRFEMVILHAVLVLGRLTAGGPAEASASQVTFDLFCVDMDRSLRELGVGDMGVPRKMREVGEAFYGRARVYDDCFARADEAGLAEAFRRNVFKDASDARTALPLAQYALAAARAVADVAPATLVDPGPRFPDPARFALAPVGAAS